MEGCDTRVSEQFCHTSKKPYNPAKLRRGDKSLFPVILESGEILCASTVLPSNALSVDSTSSHHPP